MTTTLHVVGACLYALVGAISLAMAFRSLRAKTFLPFHEAAAGRPWQTLETGLQAVVLTLLRVSGLGFLMVGLQLGVVVVGLWANPSPVVTVELPLLALLFCLGLSIVNYSLYVRTRARTPWRESAYAAVALAVALALSIAP